MAERLQEASKDPDFHSYKLIRRSDVDVDEIRSTNAGNLNILPSDLSRDTRYVGNLFALVEISKKTVKKFSFNVFRITNFSQSIRHTRFNMEVSVSRLHGGRLL
jgi:hypothetical protein